MKRDEHLSERAGERYLVTTMSNNRVGVAVVVLLAKRYT
jgi:hypothetical protein